MLRPSVSGGKGMIAVKDILEASPQVSEKVMKSIYNESEPKIGGTGHKLSAKVKNPDATHEDCLANEADLREYINILKADNRVTESLATRLVQIQISQELHLGKLSRTARRPSRIQTPSIKVSVKSGNAHARMKSVGPQSEDKKSATGVSAAGSGQGSTSTRQMKGQPTNIEK